MIKSFGLAAAIVAAVALHGCAQGGKMDVRSRVDHPTTVAFFTTAMAQPQSERMVMVDVIKAHAPDALFAGGMSFVRKAAVWHPFSPARPPLGMSDLQFRAAVWHKYLPPERGLASYEIGPIHLVIVDNPKALDPESGLARDMMDDLSRSPQPWKLVLLMRPILGAAPAPEFDAIARLLERQNVVVVLSMAGSSYARTLPIGARPESAVRFVNLPIEPPPATPEKKPAWCARMRDDGRYVLLKATTNRFMWALYDAQDRLLDTVEFRMDNRAAAAGQIMNLGEVFAAVRAAEDAAEAEKERAAAEK